MKVFIGEPTSEFVHFRSKSNLLELIINATSKDIKVIYQQQDGNRTDRNRNIILQKALEVEWDYLLWLDSDMIYPADIITKYLDAFEKTKADIMGCLYFKRKPPHEPIGYLTYGSTKEKFRAINPESLGEDELIKVVALGYGGMMVSRKVFEAMGEDRWTRYGFNFHHPDTQAEEYQSHDVWFCNKAQEYGFEIYLHGGVRPTHLTTIDIGMDHWKAGVEAGVKSPEQVTDVLNDARVEVAVIMPTINKELAEKTRKILGRRAGMNADIFLLYDKDRIGYVAMCNKFVNEHPEYKYYVPLTDDIFPSRNWLKDAYDLLQEKGGKLVGFNDGKWRGYLACCALVEREWMLKNYGGNLYFSDYNGHYNDTELTLLAMSDNVYCFDPNIMLMEVDYEKDSKKVNSEDKKLFLERKKNNFDGRVTSKELLDLFEYDEAQP